MEQYLALKIDFVITELHPGGAETCLTEVAIGLKRRGEEVRILSLGSLPKAGRDQLVNRLDDNGIQVETANADRSWQVARGLGTLKKFWNSDLPVSGGKREADRGPEIVQTFLHHANVLGTFAASRYTKAKLVGGIRVAQPRWFRGRIERRSINSMQRVVCVSNQTASFASETLGMTTQQRVVIPNAVDTDRWSTGELFDWRQLHWPADARVVLFVGRLHPQKNLQAIFRTASEFLSDAADDKRRLLFVGEGPLASEVETFCGSMPTDSIGGPRAQRLPWQSEVAGLMRSARLLVLPSHYEGMPNVVLQAMAAGRPVVCSQIEGIAELLPGAGNADFDGDQSFAVGAEPQFVRLIQQFLNDPAFADRVGRRNQVHVSQNFSVETMVDRYHDLYRSLLAEGL